jgi:phospholipase C
MDVTGMIQDGAFVLDIVNKGEAGVALTVRTLGGNGPWFYTVEAGRQLSDRLPVDAGYNFEVHGPNGFLRGFHDAAPYTVLSADCRYDSGSGELVIAVRNLGAETRELVIQALSYGEPNPRRHSLAPGEAVEDRRAIAASGHWYDIALRSGSLQRRWAGHFETGTVSHSDPAIGTT